MLTEDLEVIKEFVIESNENLSRLDAEMVALEKNPADSDLLASVFRTIHTIKGTCGFLGFGVLEKVAHHAESILSQVRNGDRDLTAELVSLILQTVDAIKAELTSIEATGHESGATYDDLVKRLSEAVQAVSPGAPAPSAAEASTPTAEPETAPAIPARPASPDAPEPLPQPVSEQSSHPTPSAVETAANPSSSHPSSAGETASSKNASISDSTIRVDVGQLDKLMNLVGELVLARNQILQFNAQHENAGLNATSQRLNLITTELQEGVMKARMQPIGMVWGKLPRVVRDLAAACGKQITLEMEGAETELDRTILEAIKDPLTHIVRNSCDHGIEPPDARVKVGKPAQGTLTLRAFHEGGNVIIEISDDGAGIDPQKVKRSAIDKGLLRPEQADRMRDYELVNLVFLPGFSTAAKVSNISGRGVGMDVVKTNIEKIGGAVDLVSRVGAGTTVKVRIPLTLAIIPGLVITSAGERFVIPQASLVELVRLEGNESSKQIEWIQGSPVYRLRNHLLPIVFLNETLKIQDGQEQAQADVFNVVVLQAEDRQFGLVVDQINDTQEIVVKPLSKQLKAVPCYAGATIMGDGKVALILDVPGLAQCAAISGEGRSQEAPKQQPRADGGQKQALLLFRAGGFERLAIPLSLVARLEEIPQSKLERAAGRTVVQYRQQILPLIPLSEHLDGSGSESKDPAQVIVFSEAGRSIGLVADEIIDIVEERVEIKRSTGRPGILGSAVVGPKIADFIDLQAIVESAGEKWFDTSSSQQQRDSVLIVEPSSFTRGLLRNALEIDGFRAIESSAVSDALEKVSQFPVSVVLTALDLPDDGAAKILQRVKNDPALREISVVALTSDGRHAAAPGFDDCVMKADRSSVIRSLRKLAAAIESADSGVRVLAS